MDSQNRTNETNGKKGLDKSLLTNLASAVLIGIGWVLPEPWHGPVFHMGLFALSGALTNWIAIHMLFEKVPGLYGSGIIPLHFEEFKSAIYRMMMDQFFTPDNLKRLLEDQKHEGIDLSEIIDETDFTPAFEALVAAVMESSFGGMLNMFGGKSSLEALRGPFTDKMKSSLKKITRSEVFQATLKARLTGGNTSHDMLEKVAALVRMRLDELTPQMVKEIIQKMIREHLGWLVIWGGVFGGVIGFFASFLPI